MKINAILFLFLLLCSTFQGFASDPVKNTPASVTGEYGTELVTLRLLPDNTFHYINTSDPAHKTETSGTWTLVENTVHLSSFPAEAQVPDKWKVDRDHPCLRSNFIGFQIIRLCQNN